MKRSGATIRLPWQAACSCEQFASKKVWSHDGVTMAIKLRVAVSSLPAKRFGSPITLPWQAACSSEQFAGEEVWSHN